MDNSSAGWTAINSCAADSKFSSSPATNENIIDEVEPQDLADLNNQMHVDLSAHKAYSRNAPYTMHYSVVIEGQKAIQAMRSRLEALLPTELIQDHFGSVIPMEAVPPQHLAKLQAKVWRELPLMVARSASRREGEMGRENVTAAQCATQCVDRIATIMAEKNSVFVLHPRSGRSCVCQIAHESFAQPSSQYEVTVEPLVDWMTLDPVDYITPLWFQIYHRNKSLLHRYSLSISKFVPRNSVTFCLNCLLFLSEYRNELWFMINNDPSILHADVPLLWPERDGGEDTVMDPDLSDDSDSSDSNNTSMPVTPIAEPVMTIPNLDGAADGYFTPRSKKFKIWRDTPTPNGERGNFTWPRTALRAQHPSPSSPRTRPVQPAACNLVNSSIPLRAPADISNNIFQSTFSLSEAEKYPHAPAGFPSGPVRRYQHGPGISFPAAPMEERGFVYSGHPPENYLDDVNPQPNSHTVSGTPEGKGRQFGDELDRNVSTSRQISDDVYFDADSEAEDVDVPQDLVELYSEAYRTTYNSTTYGGYTWPAPRDSTSPVPARPAPGADIISTDLVPRPAQMICSCRKPAKTGTDKIVQCRNHDCFIGWYHYACLDKRGKLFARQGTLLCEVCQGEQHWGKAEGVTDLSMPFTKEEALQGINGVSAWGGPNPYGVGPGKRDDEQGSKEEASEDRPMYEVVYHEDEDEDEDEEEEEMVVDEVEEGIEMEAPDENGKEELEEEIIMTDEDTEGETIGDSDEDTDETSDMEI